MNNNELQTWRETLRRRPLSPAEQSELESFLVLHPEQRENWEQETALTQLLVDLPEAPLSAGFTSRVLDAAGLAHGRLRPAFPYFRWLRLPRPALGFAGVALALALGVAGLMIQNQRAQARLAHSVADLSRQIELAASATELPAIQLLQDFEAIYRLDQPHPPLADEDLLAALQ
jgi:anti-sigma factor RsiW